MVGQMLKKKKNIVDRLKRMHKGKTRMTKLMGTSSEDAVEVEERVEAAREILRLSEFILTFGGASNGFRCIPATQSPLEHCLSIQPGSSKLIYLNQHRSPE